MYLPKIPIHTDLISMVIFSSGPREAALQPSQRDKAHARMSFLARGSVTDVLGDATSKSVTKTDSHTSTPTLQNVGRGKEEDDPILPS